MHYFEDFVAGETRDLGSTVVDHDEMVTFAERFDPQPFHTDPEAAQHSTFGGLIASGWFTGSLFMRLYVDTILKDSASQGSPGVEEIRWRRPVRAGDTLHGWTHITDVRGSQTNPGRGTIFTESELRNQDGEVVMTLRARGMFGRRP